MKEFKSRKVKFSIRNNDELTVFVNVRSDNLNEFSKLKLFKVKMPDKRKIEKINKIKTKKAILTSLSSILEPTLNKFFSVIFLGLTNLYIS